MPIPVKLRALSPVTVLRTVSIRVRFVLGVAVPALALLLAVGYEAKARAEVSADARAEVHRTEALEVLAGAQSLNAVPEGATTLRRMAAGPGQPPVLAQLAVSQTWGLIVTRYQKADDARTALAGPAREVLNEPVTAAFDRQRRAVDALAQAVKGGHPVDDAMVAEAEAARREADLAFTDLALASASDAWLIYIGAVDAVRSGLVEYFSVMPTTLGLPVATSEQLAQLAGARANATERVVLGLDPDLRAEVVAALNSGADQRWNQAVSDAQAIAAGRQRPQGLAQIAALTSDALRLEQVVETISAQAIARVRADLASAAASADHQRRELLGLAGGLLVVTAALTGWILHSITGPLGRLTRRMAAVAAGDIDGPRVEVGGDDELTRLAGTIESVVDGLRHLDRQIQAMADGRLDDPSLDSAAPGPVGTFVQQRVDDLRHTSGALRAEAASDPLTGLLNRRALADTLIGVDRPRPVALLYIDLDRFKAVNDSHGHRHGDAVLKVVAARLLGFIRPDDLAARVGGDEFVLAVHGIEPDAMDVFVSRVELALGEPIAFEGRSHMVGCSVGVAWLGPDDDLATRLEQADQAMLAVKAVGRTWSGR